jgi:hypothetical protein
MPITTVKVSDTILVDLRFYGFKWYDEDLTLLRFDKKYVVEYEVLTVNKKFITANCHAFNETWKDSSGTHCLKSYWLRIWILSDARRGHYGTH